MKNRFYIKSIWILAFILFYSCSVNIDKNSKTKEYASIYPDYTDIQIPPNIAPMNFSIEEDAKKFYVKFYSENGPAIKIKTDDPSIIIPMKKWKKLLKKNKGGKLLIDIAVKNNDNKWIGYKTITNTISEYDVDPYLVYRKINAAFVFWDEMSIEQRNIENYDEKYILQNNLTEKNCMNCHSFQQNNPENMILHTRGVPGGTLLYHNNKLSVLNTKTDYTLSSFVYPAWHPSKDFIAFSANQVAQVFNVSGRDQHHVFDKASDIVIYDIKNNSVFTSPGIATKSYENLPIWSPKGDYLYFISYTPLDVPAHDNAVKYDLLGISFNPETKEFGEVDTLIKASEAGKSISFPTPSPDGKYLLFCMADFGYFIVGSISTDLYLMDLETREYKKLNINSEYTESYHAWSKNGKWIMFTSKRDDALISLPYFSAFDGKGNFSKPFVLPQKHPDCYKTYNWNYNRPELVAGPVKVSQKEILNALYSPNRLNVTFDTTLVDVDAISGATKTAEADTSSLGQDYMKN